MDCVRRCESCEWTADIRVRQHPEAYRLTPSPASWTWSFLLEGSALFKPSTATVVSPVATTRACDTWQAPTRQREDDVSQGGPHPVSEYSLRGEARLRGCQAQTHLLLGILGLVQALGGVGVVRPHHDAVRRHDVGL